ncbi:hypothetical protein [Streptomyces sp. NPDC000134]
MLVNPGLTDPPATVNTLYAGLQIILPGETAQAHRHTSNAFRFILEGDGVIAVAVNGCIAPTATGWLLDAGWTPRALYVTTGAVFCAAGLLLLAMRGNQSTAKATHATQPTPSSP